MTGPETEAPGALQRRGRGSPLSVPQYTIIGDSIARDAAGTDHKGLLSGDADRLPVAGWRMPPQHMLCAAIKGPSQTSVRPGFLWAGPVFSRRWTIGKG